MIPLTHTLLVAAILAVAPAPEPVHIPLPPVNLGGSSFTDGMGGPSIFAREFVSTSYAPRFVGTNGETVSGDHSLATFVGITHFGFLLPTKVLGGYWGGEVLIPLSRVKVAHDGVSATGTGLGDVVASPLIYQLPPIRLSSRPFFHQRLALSLAFPTGSYARQAQVNTGSNVFSINPYYAFTLELTERVEVSARVHYLWNSENRRPLPRFGAHRIQPGQAAHLNAAVSVAIGSGEGVDARVGVAGYYLGQTVDSRVDRVAVRDSREQLAGLGPALRVSAGGFHVTFNTFWEFAGANRPVGFRAGLGVVKVWSLAPHRRERSASSG